MTDPLDTTVSTTGMPVCCAVSIRAVLRYSSYVDRAFDDGDVIACYCGELAELHGRVWINQRFAPDRQGLA